MGAPPNLGELTGDPQIILRALPLREQIDAIAQKYNERITPVVYRLELHGDGATIFSVRNGLKINARMGPLVITDVSIGGVEGVETLELGADDDDDQQNNFNVGQASGALLAPIIVRKSLEASLYDPTQDTPIGTSDDLVIGGFHASSHLAKQIEKEIGVAWSTFCVLDATNQARVTFPKQMEIAGIRCTSTVTDNFQITIAGRYVFPDGFGAGDLEPLLGPQGNARLTRDDSATARATHGLPQMPIRVEAGDEMLIPACTATDNNGGQPYVSIFGRIRR